MVRALTLGNVPLTNKIVKLLVKRKRLLLKSRTLGRITKGRITKGRMTKDRITKGRTIKR